ncbi:acyl-CoA dehydrogenase family protein [Spirillospora sp. CA-255316]
MSADFSDLPGLSEIHDELRAVARDLLGKAGPGAETDWRRIAESGWLGLEAPAALDGADATFAEVAVVLEEMGRAAACGPYLGAAVLGVGTLNLLRPGPGRDELLGRTATGEVVPAVALAGGGEGLGGDGAPGEPPFRLKRATEGLRVHGRAAFVLDAPGAGRLLLPALDPEGTPVIVDVGADAAGLGLAAQPVLDATRRFGTVTADGVAVGEASVWRFDGDPEAAVRRVHDRAAVAVACDSLGLSEAMLEATVAYAGVREQFGSPIGSFQAVKHACADMLVQVTVARRLVSAAVRALSGGDPEAWVAASMAKSYTCGAAVDVTGKAMQLHGGMGYTWESGVHVYLKRAALNRSLFGSPVSHRRRLAARYR